MTDKPSPPLLSDVLLGDTGAFNAFVEEYTSLVTTAIESTLFRYGHPVAREDVEDLRSALFLSIMEDDFRRLRQYQGRSSLATYLKVVTVRHAIDFLRRQRKVVSLSADSVALRLEDPGATPQQRLERLEQEDAVRRAVASLEPRERLLLKLVFDRELEPEQVCRILGITKSAYYNKKSRLLKKMTRLCEKSAPVSSQRSGRKRRA